MISPEGSSWVCNRFCGLDHTKRRSKAGYRRRQNGMHISTRFHFVVTGGMTVRGFMTVFCTVHRTHTRTRPPTHTVSISVPNILLRRFWRFFPVVFIFCLGNCFYITFFLRTIYIVGFTQVSGRLSSVVDFPV